jgi:hypothetical protein
VKRQGGVSRAECGNGQGGVCECLCVVSGVVKVGVKGERAFYLSLSVVAALFACSSSLIHPHRIICEAVSSSSLPILPRVRWAECD